MKQTGELLKQAREAAKLSLSEVALATKINPKILNAIENGDMAHLPAKTFLKGFVRSYALYLKMDTDEVMKVFHAETGNTPAPQIDKEVIRQQSEAAAAAKEEKAPKRRVNDDETFSGMRAIAVVVIVVLIGLIIGVRELIEKYQKETVVAAESDIKVSPLPQKAPEKPVEPTAPIATAPAVTEEPKKEEVVATAEPKQEEPKKEELKKEEPKVAPTSPPTAAQPLPVPVVAPPTSAPPPVPVPVPVPAPVVTAPTTTPGSSPAATAPNSAAVLKAAKNEIILEALDKVEVKFQVHGATKKLSLAPSQVHTIFADEPTTLEFSDGGAVNIILNGRDRGPAGDLGKPKQVKIP